MLADCLPAETTQQLHSGPGCLIGRDQSKKPVLFTVANPRYVRGQRTRVILGLGQCQAGLGRDIEQVGVDAEEVGEGALRRGQRSQAGRNRRLDTVLVVIVEGVLITLPRAVGRQPGQVERPEVAGGEFGASAGAR